jgi:hypothetical protein
MMLDYYEIIKAFQNSALLSILILILTLIPHTPSVLVRVTRLSEEGFPIPRDVFSLWRTLSLGLPLLKSALNFWLCKSFISDFIFRVPPHLVTQNHQEVETQVA